MSIHSIQQNRKLYALFNEKIEKTIPADLEIAERECLRRERYTLHTKEAFLAVPKEERPLYAIVDRVTKTVPIRKSKDVFVDLAKMFRQHQSQIIFSSDAVDYGNRSGLFFLRTQVVERLLNAEKALKKLGGKNLTFKICDTFRPLSLQRVYFERAKKEMMKREGLTGEALYERVTHLIADPETCPPHSTGGAVDLTIFDLAQQQDLNMGTAVDAMDVDMIYLWHPDISEEAKDNRMLLYTAMLSAGFSNLPIEWWHYSYGDQEWALLKDEKYAIYDSFSGESPAMA